LAAQAALGASFTTLASSDGANWTAPLGGLILDAQGNLLGVTVQGGPTNNGTVFENETSRIAYKITFLAMRHNREGAS
jgi:hypothetical protein